MPQVVPIAIAAAATGLSAAGAGTLLGATAFTVFGAAVSYGALAATALSIAGGVVSNQLNKPKLGRSSAPTPNVTVRQGVPVLPDVYGRARVGGFYALYHASESAPVGRNLEAVCVLAGHEIDEVEEIWDGDIRLWSEPGGVEAAYDDRLQVHVRLGAPGQTPPSALLAALPTTLAGAAGPGFLAVARPYVYLSFIDVRKKWGGQAPQNLWFLVRGKKLFDPRTTTTAWSDNLALVTRDYLLSRGGLLPEFMDEPAAIAAANLADENVALTGGGAHKRYRFNGAIASDTDARDFLPELMRYGVGKLVWTGASLQIQLGAYSTPVAAFGADDFRAPVRLVGETLVEERWDGVEGVFTDPAANWNATGYAGLTLDDYDPLLGDARVLTLDLSRETDHTRAERVALTTLRQSRRYRRVAVAVPLTQATIALLPGQRVTLTLAAIGLAGVFEIVARRSIYDPANPRVELEAVEDGVAFWSWGADDALAAPPSLGSNLPDPRISPPPTGLTVTAQTRTEPDGSITRWLDVSWTAPADTRYLDYYEVEWIQDGLTRRRRTTATATRIDDVGATTGVTVAVTAVNTLGVASTPATAGAVTPGGDVTPPGVPPSGAIFPMAGGFRFVIGNPTDADLAALRLFEGAADVAFGATVALNDFPATPGGADTTFVRLGLAANQTRRYFVVAVDRSGNASAAFGPLQATTPTALTVEEIDAAIANAEATAAAALVDAAAALDAVGVVQTGITAVEDDLAAEVIARGVAVTGESTARAAADEVLRARTLRPNLIVTDAFDAGVGEWTATGGFTVSTSTLAPSAAGGVGRSLAIAFDGVGGGTVDEAAWREGNLLNRTLRISGWGRTNVEGARSLTFGLRLLAPDGVTTTLARPQVVAAAAGWTFFAVDVTVGVATRSFKGSISSGGSGAAALRLFAPRVEDVTELVVAEAGITTLQTVKVDATGAVAAVNTQVNAASGGGLASVNALTTAFSDLDGDARAFDILTVEAGGNVARRTLGATPDASFVRFDANLVQFLSDRFEILNPSSGGAVRPFIVEGGVVVLDVARIRDASIGTLKIGDVQITEAKLAALAASNTGAFNADGTVTTSGVAELEVASIALTSLGRTFYLSYTGVLIPNYESGGPPSLTLRIKRGGVTLQTMTYAGPSGTIAAAQWSGFVAAGAQTFTVTVQSNDSAKSGSSLRRNLFALELRSQK